MAEGMAGMRPKVRFRRYVPELLGCGDEDWRAYAAFFAPSLRANDEVLSLGDRYLVSCEAHAKLRYMIMDRGGREPLTVQTCMQALALLSYAIDSPVVPTFQEMKLAVGGHEAFDELFSGSTPSTSESYGSSLESVAEQCEVFTQAGFKGCTVGRVWRSEWPSRGYWYHYPWPPTDSLHRAIGAYWVGTLSLLAPSRILNYWRAIEAVTTSPVSSSLFEMIESFDLAPVWSTVHRIPIYNHRPRVRDGTKGLRRVARQCWDRLVHENGSAEKAVKHVYWMLRGKAAHADQMSLEYDMAGMTGFHYQVAALLQYVARVAIERAWTAGHSSLPS